MDSTTKGHETGMPVNTATFCSSSVCSHHVHESSMLTGHAQRLQNTKFSRGYPTAIVHR